MSGGHFEHGQYRIREIAEDINRLVATNDDQPKNEFGDTKGRGYPPEVIEKFKEAAHTLDRAADMAQRVDWLVSGDDGEDSFMRRWDEEVRPSWTNDAGTPMTPLADGAKFKITITMDAELITDLKRGVSKEEIIQMFYTDAAYGLKSIVVGRLDDENTPVNDHDTEVTWDNTKIEMD